MPEFRLVFFGDVPEDDAIEVITLARRKGFTLGSTSDGQLLPPKWTIDDLEGFDLVERFLPSRYRASEGEKVRRERGKLIDHIRDLAGGRTAADLTRVTFDHFIQVHQESELGVNWEIEGAILKFMIEQRISFSDVAPAAVLRTPVRPLLTIRTYNRLAGMGLLWLELLVHVTRQQLQKIPAFGEGSEREVDAQLEGTGIRLKNE